MGEDAAVAAMKAGAHDHLIKGRLARLVPAVERELREAAGRWERRRLEPERARLVTELQAALSQVKRLSGLLPICAGCKIIRNDHGYWQQVESLISEHSEATFTHGLCLECVRRLYPALTGRATGEASP
jgi:hypothetical protein